MYLYTRITIHIMTQVLRRWVSLQIRNRPNTCVMESVMKNYLYYIICKRRCDGDGGILYYIHGTIIKVELSLMSAFLKRCLFPFFFRVSPNKNKITEVITFIIGKILRSTFCVWWNLPSNESCFSSSMVVEQNVVNVMYVSKSRSFVIFIVLKIKKWRKW